MKNIERLTRCLAKEGGKNILIHSVHGTKNWIVCEKVESDKWILTMMDPMGDSVYDLGTVNNQDHVELWKELVRVEMEERSSKIMSANELKDTINKSNN